MAKKKRKQKKSGGKHGLRNVVIVLIVLCAIGVAMSGGSDEDEGETEVSATVSTEAESEAEEAHIYDDAEIVDVMNGSQTEKVGEVSIIYAKTSDVTEDVLNDWYFNYVAANDYNYCLIVYIDAENTGCYALNGMVESDVVLKLDGDLYLLADDSGAKMYLPENNELVEYSELEMETESETEAMQTEAEKMVWISSGGTKYHRKSDCSGMTDAWQVTISEAESMGKTACSKCY